MKSSKRVGKNKKKTPRIYLCMVITADGKLLTPKELQSWPGASIIERHRAKLRKKTGRGLSKKRVARENVSQVLIPAFSDLQQPGRFQEFPAFVENEIGSLTALCENDPQMAAQLFRTGWVYELHLIICPMISGGRLRSGIAEEDGEIALADAHRLKLRHSMALGNAQLAIYSCGKSLAEKGRL